MNILEWVGITASRTPLAIGEAAPRVSTLDKMGQSVQLSDFYGDGLTLVYFYPKSDTPGCTAQACSLRDGFAELQDRGVRVIGVSADRPEAQNRFKEKFQLPFTLLSDQNLAVANAFGVPLMLGMTRRQSFLIKNGHVIWRDLSASTSGQARDVLKVIESLK